MDAVKKMISIRSILCGLLDIRVRYRPLNLFPDQQLASGNTPLRAKMIHQEKVTKLFNRLKFNNFHLILIN
jgi:hypothetical protein